MQTTILAPDGSIIEVIPADPLPVPAVVTRRQARLALHAASLLTDAEIAIVSAGPEAQVEWEDAREIHRDHPLLLLIGGALGLSPAAIDELFQDAAAR